MRTARLAEAEAACTEALTTYRAVENRLGEANTLISSGELARRNGDTFAAKKTYDAAVTLRGLAVVDLLEGRDATEALQVSASLAAAAQDHHGTLLSRMFLAVADSTTGAAAALDELAASFAALGFPWEASLSRALARLKAGEVAEAASLLRDRPETSLLAQEISQAMPEQAVKLLLLCMPIT